MFPTSPSSLTAVKAALMRSACARRPVRPTSRLVVWKLTLILTIQAAHAQANLHNATQQARVAAINAAASQAALDASSQSQTPGSRTPTNNKGTPQTMKKTAGRYALADFAIERT
jgi:hypothetical protein